MYKDSNCRIIDGKLLYVVVFSSFFSLGLLAYRLFCNISFLEPSQLITSGCEESSLFSIWKYIHGYEVYGSPYKVPFAASYFNWLFYSFYGSVIKIAQKLFFLNDEWIPTVGRIITSIGCLCGITIVYKGLKTFSSYKDNATKFFYLSLAIYTFTGPLIGFWALTVRPDVWMLVFESLALVMFLNILKAT